MYPVVTDIWAEFSHQFSDKVHVDLPPQDTDVIALYGNLVKQVSRPP